MKTDATMNNPTNRCKICYGLLWGHPEFTADFFCMGHNTTAESIPTQGKQTGDEENEDKEDERIMRSAETDAFIIEWFKKWCDKRKVNGWALLNTTIQELLKDFYNSIIPSTLPASDADNQNELWERAQSILASNSYYQYYGENERLLKTKPQAIEELKSQFTITKNKFK
jgi:hypothetical protein